MDFFETEYPEPPTIDVKYVSFGQRLRTVRKEKGLTQNEFAALLGSSKQVLSRYEIGQRIPKITQVQQYAKALNVSADYLMGDSEEETAFNSLCPGNQLPFYKIFISVTKDMGLNIPDIVRVTGLTDRQIHTIILRRMKDAPLPIALQLSDTLGVPPEVWAGRAYTPRDTTVEAGEVARAYDNASLKDKNIARMALGVEPVKGAGNGLSSW